MTTLGLLSRAIPLRVGSRALAFRGLLVLFLCGGASSTALLELPRLLVGTEAHLNFDLEISDGQNIGLFVNRFDRPPQRLPVVPGKRHTYSFGEVYTDVTAMRLDVTDVAGVTVMVYGASISDAKGIIAQIPAVDFSKWGLNTLSIVESGDGFVKYTTTGNNPYFLTGTRFPIRQTVPDWLASLARSVSTIDFLVPLVAIGFLLLAAVRMLDRERRADLPLALCVGLLVALVVPWVIQHSHGLSPISAAVGRAGFFGTSAQRNSSALLVALSGTVVLALAAFYLHRLFGAPRSEDAPRGPAPAIWLAAGAIIVFLVVVPDIAAQLRAWTTATYSPDWDGNNILTWAWLAHRGYEPLRDFWYPYGGMFLFDLPAPWSLVCLSLYKAWIFVVLFLVIARLSKHALAALLATLVLALGDGLIFPGIWRYLLGLILALSYLAIGPRGEWRAVFWINCLVVTVFDVVQLGYAAPAVAIKIAFDLWQARPRRFADFALRLAKDFTVPAVAAGLYLALLISRGEGRGLADLLLGLGDAGIYSAEPADLAGAAYSPFSVQFTIMVAPLALIAIGLFERLRGNAADRFADIMMAVGIVGFMMLQKHLVRSMDWQLFFIPFLGAVFYCVFSHGERSVIEKMALGLVLGATLAALTQLGALQNLRQQLAGAPARVANDLALVFVSDERIATANEQRFAPAKFESFRDEHAVVADLKARANGLIPTFFVLGDSPVVYLLAGQVPPYHVNDYNASPIYEQRKVADFLNRERPATVIWDPRTANFELFQAVVRNPLIYNTVVDDYVPDRRVGRFDILRRRATNEPIAFEFWRNRLGPVVDFGHFARRSSFRTMAACPERSAAPSGCQDFLVVTKRDPNTAGRLVVKTTVAGLSFDIAMQTVPGDRELIVSLDRVWFWHAAKYTGSDPKLEGLSGAAAELAIQRAASRPDILY